ncbi:hypothetical protein D3C75_804560 [compost metagenome]
MPDRGFGLQMEFLVAVFLENAHLFLLDNSALLDKSHPVAQPLHLAQNMAGKENRGALPVFLGDQLEETLLHQRVQTAGRLIQNNELGLMEQTLDNAHLFLIAEGQVVNPLLQIQIHSLRQLDDPLPAVLLVEAGRVAQQLSHPHAVIIEHLGGQITHLPADFRMLRTAFAQDQGAAGGRGDQAQQGPDGGGFACAVGADKPENLALRHT